MRLLPYLDQQPLFASINFSVETFPSSPDGAFPFPQNQTAFASARGGLPVSDGRCPDSDPYGCNYRGNYGVGPNIATSQETYDSGNGFYSFPGVLGPQSFPDGLSHTVAYSERLRGSDRGGGLAPARDFGNIMVIPYCTDRDADYALACCQLAATRGFPAYRGAGFTWFYGDFECTAYDHAQEPNGRIPDAITGTAGWIGVASARSLHPQGVNGLMADGSVRFFSDSVVRKVRRGLGTRNGDELVE